MPFSSDCGRAGDEDGCSRASMVDDCEYCIVCSILWELGDEVHRYFFEWVCLWSWCNAVHWGVHIVHQVFVLLAGGASLDVAFYPLIHAWPPVFLLHGLGGLVSAWVSSSQGIVVVSHDLPP